MGSIQPRSRCALVLTTVLMATSCVSNVSEISIDLANLKQAAALGGIELSSFELRVFSSAQSQEPALVLQLDENALSFDVEVDAGPNVGFEIIAVGSSQDLPVYWGSAVVNLVPRTTVDLVIPVFPAGVVSGDFSVGDGSART